MPPLLEVRDLKTSFFTEKGIIRAVDGISFTLHRGKTLAMVGESGCGKSMTALSLLRLIPEPGRITGGEILLDGENLLALSEDEMRSMRGQHLAMVFQEPMTALNPVLKIGDQIAEVLQLHERLSYQKALRKAVSLLEQVGVPDPQQRLDNYPHQLSGGLRQRVIIAMALACDPQILIADEPTTALDVTIQAQIMELLRQLQDRHQMAILLITHDLGIVAESADDVVIMYAGLIVEQTDVKSLFKNPSHPYTRGLLASLPRTDDKRGRLTPIKGQVPPALDRPTGCPFRNRCPEAIAKCAAACPELKPIETGHAVRCWRRE
ncbi:MAG: peptide ABC transporter ATP-binding protein [Desulfuromonas sp.]|nr:MAG: peptide ABC transporter ATP-binding protein [Desulfuromonas sp.]